MKAYRPLFFKLLKEHGSMRQFSNSKIEINYLITRSIRSMSVLDELRLACSWISGLFGLCYAELILIFVILLYMTHSMRCEWSNLIETV